MTRPPLSSTVCATIDRPSPEPGSCRDDGERQNRSKTYCSSSSGMPGPWSRTVNLPWCRVTSTAPAGGLYFTALSSRFITARSNAAASARVYQGSRATW